MAPYWSLVIGRWSLVVGRRGFNITLRFPVASIHFLR
jgi:hypothetical protein